MGQWQNENEERSIEILRFNLIIIGATERNWIVGFCYVELDSVELVWLDLPWLGSAWLKYNRLTKGHKRHNRAFISMWTNEKTEKKTPRQRDVQTIERYSFWNSLYGNTHSFLISRNAKNNKIYRCVYARLVRCCFQPNGSCRKVTKLKLSCVFSTREKN